MKHIYTIGLSLILSLIATPALAQTYYNQYNQPYYYTPEPTRVYPVSAPVVVNRVEPVSAPIVSNMVVNRVEPRTTATVADSGSGRSGFGAFSGNGKTKALAISNIQVVSGPRNINTAISGANCGVAVSWTTTQPTVGQVLYGTVSQPDASSFQYEQAAVEGSSPATNHSVTLPSCISGTATYKFRIVAYTPTGYLVSDEQTILPLPVEIAAAPAGNNIVLDATTAGASVLGTLGKFAASPIFLVLVIGLLVFLVVKKLGLGKYSGGGHGGGHGEEVLDEPIIAIPHH